MAFYQLEPWGWKADNLAAAVTASAAVNIQIAEGKATSPSDFMIDFDDVYEDGAEVENPADPDAVARQFELLIWHCVN